MRTNENNVPEEHQGFSQWLLNLGDGKLQEPGLEEVIEPEDESITNRAILTPKNEHSHELNESVLRRIQSELKCYTSIDSIQQDTANAEEADNYPMEFLNSLMPGGMPPHRLNLKVGAVVILLRNLNSIKGLCNGTRIVVKQMMSKETRPAPVTKVKVGAENGRFFKVATFCIDDCFAHFWHSLDELQEVVTGIVFSYDPMTLEQHENFHWR
ncbi:unnamed protein product, partial [Ranitomeya imitator]